MLHSHALLPGPRPPHLPVSQSPAAPAPTSTTAEARLAALDNCHGATPLTRPPPASWRLPAALAAARMGIRRRLPAESPRGSGARLAPLLMSPAGSPGSSPFSGRHSPPVPVRRGRGRGGGARWCNSNVTLPLWDLCAWVVAGGVSPRVGVRSVGATAVGVCRVGARPTVPPRSFALLPDSPSASCSSRDAGRQTLRAQNRLGGERAGGCAAGLVREGSGELSHSRACLSAGRRRPPFWTGARCARRRRPSRTPPHRGVVHARVGWRDGALCSRSSPLRWLRPHGPSVSLVVPFLLFSLNLLTDLSHPCVIWVRASPARCSRWLTWLAPGGALGDSVTHMRAGLVVWHTRLLARRACGLSSVLPVVVVVVAVLLIGSAYTPVPLGLLCSHRTSLKGEGLRGVVVVWWLNKRVSRARCTVADHRLGSEALCGLRPLACGSLCGDVEEHGAHDGRRIDPSRDCCCRRCACLTGGGGLE